MKRIFCISLALILLFNLPFLVFAERLGEPRALTSPSVSARSALLMDADSGRILCEKNARERMGMASTTKLMTALVALSLSDKDRMISVPKEAVGIEGSSIYLTEDERLTLEELLFALLLSSANDAAAAIAISLSGSIEVFAEKMNDYAKALGLKDTHFTNPHGLYGEDHYTTASDLAIIAAEALKNETLRRIVSTKKATIPHDGKPNARLLTNHNKLLKSYDGAIGMKTGFTRLTGRCLVSAAQRDGLTLICVTLDAPDDWRDHTALLDFGFDNFERRIFYAAGTFSYSLPLCDSQRDSISLTNTEPLTLTVRKGSEISVHRIEAPFRFAIGSVKRGSFFGEVAIISDGQTAHSPLIFAESSIGNTRGRTGFFERIFTFFLPDEQQ